MRRLIINLAVMLGLTACVGRDGVDGPVEMSKTDIATFIDNTPAGSDFELVATGDAPSLFLHSDRRLDTARVKPGERVLIAYYGPESDGAIRLAGTGTVFNDSLLSLSEAKIRELDVDPVWLLAMWRTGPYINVRARLGYSDQPRVWALALDKSTAGDEVPRLSLIHRMPRNVSADSTWMSMTYSSFNIGELWSRPHVRGVEIAVRNSNLTDLTTIRFDK